MVVYTTSFEELERPEFECQCSLGKEQFYFFHPISIKRFTVQIWTRSKDASTSFSLPASNPLPSTWNRITNSKLPKDELKFSVSIFEDGEKLSLRDSRFVHKKWLQKLLKSWQKEEFSKEEINQILQDLHQL